jgi:hypothetical protein
VDYVRGWDDCLEVVESVLDKARDLEQMRAKILELRKLVRENKFRKIRYEMRAFNVF